MQLRTGLKPAYDGWDGRYDMQMAGVNRRYGCLSHKECLKKGVMHTYIYLLTC